MKNNSNFEDNTWRIISSFLILCWLMVIFYNYNKGTLSLVLIPAIISMGISVYAIIKPQFMWPYAVQGTFWGFMYIYTSGGITGFLLLFLGICFDIKCGFFKRFLIPKVLFLFACLVLVLYHVYTIDSKILFDTLLDSIVVILVILMLSLLFSKDIPLKFVSVEESNGGIRQIFNEHEIAYIKLLGQNYKFYSIAQMLNVSESSVKRTFSKMYNKVNVKGKTEFLSKIKEIATEEELAFLNLAD
jgi:DNA-binding CsgD family transcriptional regulator